MANWRERNDLAKPLGNCDDIIYFRQSDRVGVLINNDTKHSIYSWISLYVFIGLDQSKDDEL